MYYPIGAVKEVFPGEWRVWTGIDWSKPFRTEGAAAKYCVWWLPRWLSGGAERQHQKLSLEIEDELKSSKCLYPEKPEMHTGVTFEKYLWDAQRGELAIIGDSAGNITPEKAELRAYGCRERFQII
jgi:hypothetical protein